CDRCAHAAGAVEPDVRGRDVEDADEAGEVVPVDRVQARVGEARLLWAGLEHDDPPVLVATEDVDVTAAVHRHTAGGGDVEDHRSGVHRARAANRVGARGRVDALVLVREVTTWRRCRGRVRGGQGGGDGRVLVVRRLGAACPLHVYGSQRTEVTRTDHVPERLFVLPVAESEKAPLQGETASQNWGSARNVTSEPFGMVPDTSWRLMVSEVAPVAAAAL